MSSLPLSVRPATLEDAPTILSIFSEAEAQTDFKSGINLIGVMDWVESADELRPLWVLESDQAIIGWCSLENFYGLPSFDGVVEVAIYIQHDYQRLGCGHWLLNYIAKQAGHLDIHTLVAYVLMANHNSHTFFLKNNFETWGRLPNVARYGGVHGDLVLLGRQLG